MKFFFYKILIAVFVLSTFVNTTYAQDLPTSVLEVISRWQTEPNQKNLAEIKNAGFTLLRENKFQEALQVFEKILEKYPNEPFGLYGKGISLFNLRKVAEAQKFVDSAVEIFLAKEKTKSLAVEPLVLSAVISAVQKDNAQAIEKLKNAISISPDHFGANFSLGRAFYGNGDLENAVIFFEKAVKIQPENPQSRFFLATSLEQKADYGKALDSYRELVKLSPDNADGQLGLGVLLLKLEGKDSEEGLNALKKAVRLNGNSYESRVSLGKALLRLNRSKEAVEHLLKAIELKPEIPEPHYQLAMAYQKLGKKAEAKAELAKVKEIHEKRRGSN